MSRLNQHILVRIVSYSLLGLQRLRKNFSIFNGCATPQDNLWPTIELNLNIAYKALIKSGTNYDWIGGVCTWTIIGIFIGILGGIAIIIGVVLKEERQP